MANWPTSSSGGVPERRLVLEEELLFFSAARRAAEFDCPSESELLDFFFGSRSLPAGADDFQTCQADAM